MARSDERPRSDDAGCGGGGGGTATVTGSSRTAAEAPDTVSNRQRIAATNAGTSLMIRGDIGHFLRFSFGERSGEKGADKQEPKEGGVEVEAALLASKIVELNGCGSTRQSFRRFEKSATCYRLLQEETLLCNGQRKNGCKTCTAR